MYINVLLHRQQSISKSFLWWWRVHDVLTFPPLLTIHHIRILSYSRATLSGMICTKTMHCENPMLHTKLNFVYWWWDMELDSNSWLRAIIIIWVGNIDLVAVPIFSLTVIAPGICILLYDFFHLAYVSMQCWCRLLYTCHYLA